MRLLGREVLRLLAKKTLAKHKPTIIGLVGTGETAICREIIYTLLSQSHPTRRNLESPSVEFSVPLTILGADKYPGSLLDWIKLTLITLIQLNTLRPYKHFLILELSGAKKKTADYWLSIVKPDLVVICGKSSGIIPIENYKTFKITGSTLAEIKKESLKIDEMFGGDAENDGKSLEGITFYPTRIRFLPGTKGKLIIDSTHYYYPIPLKAVLELSEDLPGRKLVITEERLGPLPKGFQKSTPRDLERIDEFPIVIVRGRRTERFDLLEQLTSGNYE